MATFIGQVNSEPKHRDGVWYFVIWVAGTNEEISCVSSKTFDLASRNVPLDIKPLDKVEVIGVVIGPRTCFFDSVRVLKKSEETPNR